MLSSSDLLDEPCQRSIPPIYKKIIDDSSFIRLSGIRFEIEPPATAPIRLASNNANAAPMKTAKGLFVDPLKDNIANCVLSPISARKTVVNVVSKIVISIIYKWLSNK